MEGEAHTAPPRRNARALQRSAYKPLLLGNLLRKFFNGFFPCAPPLLRFFGGLAIAKVSRGESAPQFPVDCPRQV